MCFWIRRGGSVVFILFGVYVCVCVRVAGISSQRGPGWKIARVHTHVNTIAGPLCVEIALYERTETGREAI